MCVGACAAPPSPHLHVTVLEGGEALDTVVVADLFSLGSAVHLGDENRIVVGVLFH